eukprot:2263762-Rhodomonas_salina.2
MSGPDIAYDGASQRYILRFPKGEMEKIVKTAGLPLCYASAMRCARMACARAMRCPFVTVRMIPPATVLDHEKPYSFGSRKEAVEACSLGTVSGSAPRIRFVMCGADAGHTASHASLCDRCCCLRKCCFACAVRCLVLTQVMVLPGEDRVAELAVVGLVMGVSDESDEIRTLGPNSLLVSDFGPTAALTLKETMLENLEEILTPWAEIGSI